MSDRRRREYMSAPLKIVVRRLRGRDWWSASMMMSLALIALTVNAEPRPVELPLRLSVLAGEAELRHARPRPTTLRKPVGEQVNSFDITEVTLRFDATSSFPSQARAEFTFRALVDELEDVAIFILGSSADQLSAQISYDGTTFSPVRVNALLGGPINLNLPQPLASGASATIKLEYEDVTWADEGPPNAVDNGSYAHLVSYKYIPFNGESFLYDFIQLRTVITAPAGIYPSALGALINRPDEGQDGVWEYRSEVPTILSVYSVGGGYPVSVDGRVEVFHPAPFVSSDSATEIEELASEVATFYDGLYGDFPFSRLGVAPISDDTGAAIGPQAQILLPQFFWFDGIELDATFDRAGVIYHEVAHQYFFNLVRLDPNPEKGQAWLSEAMAETSALQALDELQGSSELHRSVNFTIYESSTNEEHLPVASVGINEDPNYFSVVYLLGSTLVYGLAHRMVDYRERMRDCITSWRGLFIDTADMYSCFRSMTPKEGYMSFDLDQYIARYFTGINFDEITVTASYISDEESALTLSSESWSDTLEVVTYAPEGESLPYYPPRDIGVELTYSGASARVDPMRTTPRRVTNQNSVDVDLNGVIDGQDALDVLFHRGADRFDFNRVFPRWADVDRDEQISDADLTEVVRQMGSYQR